MVVNPFAKGVLLLQYDFEINYYGSGSIVEFYHGIFGNKLSIPIYL